MKWWHFLFFSQKSPQSLHIVKTISSLGKTVIIKKLLVLPSLPCNGRLKQNLSLPACFPAIALPAPHPLRRTYNPLGRAAVRIGTPGMDVRIGTTSPESGPLAAERALEGAVSHCIPPDSCDPGWHLLSPMKGLGHAGWRWLGTRGRKKEKWPFFFFQFSSSSTIDSATRASPALQTQLVVPSGFALQRSLGPAQPELLSCHYTTRSANSKATVCP